MLPHQADLVAHASAIQATLFGVLIVTVWTFEKFFLGACDGRKIRRTWTNGLFAIFGLPIQLAMAILCVNVANWGTAHHWGLLHLLPYCDSPWIKYGLLFFVLDLLDYVYHYAMHHVPALWRFHLVHHTDHMVDVSTTVREHPGETGVRNGFLIIWVIITGAPVEVLVLRQTAETISNILAHTALRLPGRWDRLLGLLFVTPNSHQVHHHPCQPYTDSNFGDVFSIWDRLLGTFVLPRTVSVEFGLDTHASTLGDDQFGRALAMPFNSV